LIVGFNSEMVRQEEIAAAKVAKAAIAMLAVASRQETIRTLRKANRIATLAMARGFANEEHLVDARNNAGIALSELVIWNPSSSHNSGRSDLQKESALVSQSATHIMPRTLDSRD
jgi:hypothetical protein